MGEWEPSARGKNLLATIVRPELAGNLTTWADIAAAAWSGQEGVTGKAGEKAWRKLREGCAGLSPDWQECVRAADTARKQQKQTGFASRSLNAQRELTESEFALLTAMGGTQPVRSWWTEARRWPSALSSRAQTPEGTPCFLPEAQFREE